MIRYRCDEHRLPTSGNPFSFVSFTPICEEPNCSRPAEWLYELSDDAPAPVVAEPAAPVSCDGCGSNLLDADGGVKDGDRHLCLYCGFGEKPPIPAAPVSASRLSCRLDLNDIESTVLSKRFPADAFSWQIGDGLHAAFRTNHFVVLKVSCGVQVDVTTVLTPQRAYEIGEKLKADALAAGYVVPGAEVAK